MSDEDSISDRQLASAIRAPHVDVETTVRELAWNGIPEKHRATTWKLLLEYLPQSVSERASTLKHKRGEYLEKAVAAMASVDDEQQNVETLRQVSLDVMRIAPTIALFRHETIQSSLKRALYMFAMEHPSVCYVQGFHDLLSPLVAVFLQAQCFPHVPLRDLLTLEDADIQELLENVPSLLIDFAEADAYWCLSAFLSNMLHHYTDGQPGIRHMLGRFEQLTEAADEELHRHLQNVGVEFFHFGFRWINCLLIRELPFLSVVRLWDTLLSEEDDCRSEFFCFCCIAVLHRFRADLLACNDFEQVLLLLQNLPTRDFVNRDVELLASQAHVFRSTVFIKKDFIDEDDEDDDETSATSMSSIATTQSFVDFDSITNRWAERVHHSLMDPEIMGRDAYQKATLDDDDTDATDAESASGSFMTTLATSFNELASMGDVNFLYF